MEVQVSPIASNYDYFIPNSTIVLNKYTKNNNLLSDLKKVDKLLDDIYMQVCNTNIESIIYDHNQKSFIEILKKNIQYKNGVLYNEINNRLDKRYYIGKYYNYNKINNCSYYKDTLKLINY